MRAEGQRFPTGIADRASQLNHVNRGTYGLRRRENLFLKENDG